MAAPPPHGPARGPRADNVGAGHDFVAQVSSGVIAQATGAFVFAYNTYQNPGETDSMFGPNAFSLQLNANFFPTDLCGATPYPQCAGWEQFVFDNNPGGQYFSGVYIQYWLVNAESCPSSWTLAPGSGCYFNSPGTLVSPVTIADLDNLDLQGAAGSSGDVVSLTNYGTGEMSAMGQDSLLNLSQNWNTVEFNIFGAGDGSEAEFNAGTVIGVQTSVIAPSLPACVSGGFTAEYTNLTLAPPCLAYGSGPVLGGTLGSIEFWEGNASVPAPPSLSTGSASAVTATTAGLNGTVNPYESGPLIWFQYSTSSGALNCTAPTLTTPQDGSALPINLPAPFSHGVSGLSSGTTYHFVTCALYSGGLVQGSVASFTTLEPCTYSLTSNSASFGAGASDGSVGVTATAGCSWAASSNAAWLTITSGSSGSGDGTVSFSFPANTGEIARPGTLTIAGQTFTVTQAANPAPLAFYPLTPCRVADTRAGSGFSGAFGAPYLSGGATRSFPLPSSSCSVPDAALAYSVNFGALPHGPLGYLTAWPAGSPLPLVGTLGSPTGQQVSNAAIVPAGTGGAIDIFVSDDTDLIIDINGYFAAPNLPLPLAFYPITPCRVADTRVESGFSGAFGAPYLSANVTRIFPMPSSSCGLPATAQAYSLNFGALPYSPLGYLTAWPAGSSLPLVGTLGSPSGSPVSNAALVPAGTGGAISIDASADTDLIVDSNGYFAAPGSPGALNFYPLTPCRVADTRSPGSGLTGAFGPPIMSAGETREFPIPLSSCGVPDTAQGYSLNIGVVTPGPLEYLTVWPAGQSMPTVGTLNSPGAGIVSDAAIVPAGTGGAISLFVSNLTDVIIDIDGYFAP